VLDLHGLLSHDGAVGQFLILVAHPRLHNRKEEQTTLN
jgi:hypothetical protein